MDPSGCRGTSWTGSTRTLWVQDVFNIMDVERSASENEHTKKPTRKTVKQLVMTQIYICGRAATSSGRSVYSGSKGGSEKKLKRK